MSTTKRWNFRALDTLFFREGNPFHAGEGGFGTGVSGRFPPSINTLQGAIRTTLAYGQGWRPEKQDCWPVELGTEKDLGRLKLAGPYLQWNNEVLFPAPLLLLRQKETGVFTRLTPGTEPVNCDLEEQGVYLPVPQERLAGAKIMDNCRLSCEGMERVLAGGLPKASEVKEQGELWQEEYRVGIEINRASRTAKDGQLYSITHVRPKPEVSLTVEVSGVPTDWHPQLPTVIRLGGEGRTAELRVTNPEPLLPTMPELVAENGMVRFVVILITPGKYAQQTQEVIRQGPPNVPGSCLSACIGKLQQAGGWDLLNGRPKPLEPLIPAGALWFFEASAERLAEIKELHGSCTGQQSNYGYGQIVIGKWGKGNE